MSYLDALANEIRGAVADDALPDEETSSLFRMYAVLLLAKGAKVTPEDIHNAWVAWMVDKGESHESLVPFGMLPAETKEEDSPFVVAIQTVARRRRPHGPGGD
jgi:hypothetical protein